MRQSFSLVDFAFVDGRNAITTYDTHKFTIVDNYVIDANVPLAMIHNRLFLSYTSKYVIDEITGKEMEDTRYRVHSYWIVTPDNRIHNITHMRIYDVFNAKDKINTLDDLEAVGSFSKL